MLTAATVTTVGSLPVFLLSAQATLIRADLHLSEFQLGVAVSTFFTAAALASVPAGRSAQRLGWRVSTMLAGTLAAISLLGVATATASYPALVTFLVVGGLANAASQVSANLLLATAVPRRRQGLGFGLKQSAIPIATLLGGLAVPAVGLTVGWRWAYAGAAVIAVTIAVLSVRLSGPSGRCPAGTTDPYTVRLSITTRPLVLVAIATALASCATNAFGAFLVVWSVEAGLASGHAGMLLAVASLLCIAVRIGSGMAADRRDGRNLPVVAIQLVIGALGMLLLATGSTATVIIGALVAFGIGWSWPGLLVFAVVRVSPDAPARTSSLVQAGAFVGGASGPGAFGVLAHGTSFPVAWCAVASVMVVAAALLVLARMIILNASR